jgi:peptidoglycan/LPS O-acetylase OafA/YrhL
MNPTIYRKEIDGLRALAILPVVFFHAGISGFSGGYVGVDIFYVISGYLITTIIYREIHHGEFKFRAFWTRRARRILPASIFLVLVCIPVFAFIFPSNLFENFIQSVVANQFFGSNILFWKEGGYFSTAQELKPLLHTWSLSIEEQFYILFPILLLMVYKHMKTHIILIVAFLITLSFLLSIYASKYHSYAAFYLIPTRAWELGVGGLIALMGEKHFPKIRSSTLTQWLGITMILSAIFLFDQKTPFPSFYAALPVFGTALLILSKKPESIITRVLCSAPFLWIGLISYSVYLWHWPIMVIKKWVFPHSDSFMLSVIAILLSIGLGYASYIFVEKPTRNRLTLSDRQLIKGVLATSAITLIISLTLYKLGNSAFVDPTESILAVYKRAIEPEQSRGKCTNNFLSEDYQVCGNLPLIDQRVDLFVWGDSHAGAMIPAFYKLSEDRQINFQYSITLGCQPILGTYRADQYQSCLEVNQLVIDHIAKEGYSKVVLIGSFVNNTITGKLRDIEGNKDADLSTRLLEFSKRFKQTVSEIQQAGAKVYVFTEPPRYQVSPPLEILRSSTLGVSPSIPELKLVDHIKWISPVYDLIDQSGIDGRLDYSNSFCPNGTCVYQNELGELLLKDSNHMSNIAAESLAEDLINDLGFRGE